MEPAVSHEGDTNPAMVPGPAGKRAGLEWLASIWKVILFLLITALFGPGIFGLIALKLFGAPGQPLPLNFFLFVEVGQFAVVVVTSLLLAAFERRPFGDYGLPWSDAFAANFWVGLLLGLAEGSVLVGSILLLGGYSFGTFALHGAQIITWGLLQFVLFLFVGLYEEFVFRGYAQYGLSKVIGFWPAAVLLSAGFGCVHLLNANEGWVGAAGVALVGLLFCFALKRSGNLWYAVGLHAGFDWAESFLYSVPDSGQMMQGHLSNAVLHGPKWLTGGSIGPEGSVFCFLTLGVQFLVVHWLFPARKTEAPAEIIAVHS